LKSLYYDARSEKHQIVQGKIVRQVGFIYKIIQGCTVNKT